MWNIIINTSLIEKLKSLANERKYILQVSVEWGTWNNSQMTIKFAWNCKLHKFSNSFLIRLSTRILYLIGLCILISFFQIHPHCNNENVHHIKNIKIIINEKLMLISQKIRYNENFAQFLWENLKRLEILKILLGTLLFCRKLLKVHILSDIKVICLSKICPTKRRRG